MPLRVKRLPRAIADALDIWLHIAEDNMSAADGVVQSLDQAIGKLADYPELGPARPILGKDIRILPVDSITVFYRVEDGYVEIVRILHSAREITPGLLSG